jgi:hypothetical protein
MTLVMDLPSVWQEAINRVPSGSLEVPNEIQKKLMNLIEDPTSPTAIAFWARVASKVSNHESELLFEFFRNAHIIVRFLRDPIIVLRDHKEAPQIDKGELYKLPRFCYHLIQEAETGIYGVFVDGPQRVVEMTDGRIVGYHSEEDFTDPVEGRIAADSEWLLLNASLQRYVESPPTIVPAFPGYSPYGARALVRYLTPVP